MDHTPWRCDGRSAQWRSAANLNDRCALLVYDGRRDVRGALSCVHQESDLVRETDTPKDPGKMVVATADALQRAGVYEGTPVDESLFLDDARRVLIGVLKAAKRQKWEVTELLELLERRKPKPTNPK